MTLLVVGALGLLVLLGVGGTVGARYAEADRAETLEAENRPAQPVHAAGVGDRSRRGLRSRRVVVRRVLRDLPADLARGLSPRAGLTSPRSPGRP